MISAVVVLTAVDLDEPAVEKGRGLGLEEDEAQPVGVGMELVRVVQPEIDAAEPRAVEPGDRGAFELGMVDCRQLSLGCRGEKSILIGHDPARDHDLTGEGPIDVIDIGTGAPQLARQRADAADCDDRLGKSRAQIAVAHLGQPLKMRDEPRAVSPIGASASPTNNDRGHLDATPHLG